MKLYKVTLVSMIDGYSPSYVVAEDPQKAYRVIRDFLDKEYIAFKSDREMKSVELIADTYQYSDCGKMLFVSKGKK